MKSVFDPLVPIKYSICIITYKRPESLRLCLDSISVCLVNLSPNTYEVLVSDDCPLQSALGVASSFEFVKWIQGPCRGVAANRNNVVNAANGEWIVFIDDDEIADNNWLFHFNKAIISGGCDVIEGRVQPTNFPDSILWYAPTISKGGAFCTANLAINREIFHELGGFDESFSVSHEDVDFGRRIRNAGCRSIYLNQSVVYHPARRYSFREAWIRLLDLQCQSYFTNISPPYNLKFNSIFQLFSFCIKYWFRIFRFEMSARYTHHWRRQLQVMLLLFLSTPLAFLRLLKVHIGF